MDSHYVERHLCTRIGPRTYAMARGSGKRKKVMFDYYYAVEVGQEMATRLSNGILAHN